MFTQGFLRLWLGFVLTFFFTLPGVAASDLTFKTLTEISPTVEGLQIKDVKIERDAFKVNLQSGVLYPLRIENRVVGCVFLGKGQFELAPADESERKYLALRTGNKELTTLFDSFEKATFLFSDGTWESMQKAGTPAQATDKNDAVKVYEDFLKKEHKILKINLHLRILADLLENTPKERAFFAVAFKGRELAPAIAIFDPRGLAATGFDAMFGTETTALSILDEEDPEPVWYSHTPKGIHHPEVFMDPFEVQRYEIDTTLENNLGITAKTTIFLKGRQEGVRLVSLDLFYKLRLRSVSLTSQGTTTELPFLQAPDNYQNQYASWVATILPKALGKGEEATLTLTYSGKEVLQGAGGDNYYVGARTSWYPNFGVFTSATTYDLVFRAPNKKEVVSVGRLVSKTTEGKSTVFRFHTDTPVRVAGFNYGGFGTLERKDAASGLTLRVHTNQGSTQLASFLMDSGAVVGNMNPESFQENAMADATNAARIGVNFFGPLKIAEIGISQQPNMGFGQSWPSLVFLPYLAFMSSTHRVQLGLGGANEFANTVGYHELSHQWWGHQVGWATYRDQWLSEGFAEFSTGLAVQFVEGADKYRRFLEHSRKQILERGRGSKVPNPEAGPIFLGHRLSSKQAPSAYQGLVYHKGAFVVHMLRSMLYNKKNKDPEERFKKLMKDFTSSWAYKTPTTEDFRALVAKHVEGSSFGDMRWFFDQWIYGTELPKIEQSFEVKEIGNGLFKVTGKIVQSEVSNNFRSFIPIYLEITKGRFVRLGQAVLNGNCTFPMEQQVKLDKAPVRAVANVFYDLLTKD